MEEGKRYVREDGSQIEEAATLFSEHFRNERNSLESKIEMLANEEITKNQ